MWCVYVEREVERVMIDVSEDECDVCMLREVERDDQCLRRGMCVVCVCGERVERGGERIHFCDDMCGVCIWKERCRRGLIFARINVMCVRGERG